MDKNIWRKIEWLLFLQISFKLFVRNLKSWPWDQMRFTFRSRHYLPAEFFLVCTFQWRLWHSNLYSWPGFMHLEYGSREYIFQYYIHPLWNESIRFIFYVYHLCYFFFSKETLIKNPVIVVKILVGLKGPLSRRKNSAAVTKETQGLLAQYVMSHFFK